MAKGEHAGSGGVFWITFVVLGLAILIALFVWMVKSRKQVPHTPERSARKVWSEPVAEIDDEYRVGGRETADPSPDIRPLPPISRESTIYAGSGEGDLSKSYKQGT